MKATTLNQGYDARPSLLAHPATPADANTLLALMGYFYAEEHLDFAHTAAERSLRELLAAPELGTVLRFTLADEVIGYAVITFGFSLEFHGRFALLDEFYLAPSARGRGLGRLGLEVIQDWARTTAVATLRLEVNRINARARSLYLAVGFHDEQRDLYTQWLHPTPKHHP